MEVPEFTMPFSMILSQLGEYRASFNLDHRCDINGFSAWLETHDYADLADLLTSNSNVAAAVVEILDLDTAELLASLSILDNAILDFEMKPAFRNLASALRNAYE